MWSKKGIYNKLNREGKSIRKYPDGDDPLKIKLFGKTRECSKCGKRKSILRFHWKSFYKTKTQKVRRIQAQCGACRVKYDNLKYSKSPEAYIRRRLMNLKQDCRSKRGRKKVLLTYKQLIAIYKRQVKRRGLICPLSGIEMTYTLGKGDILTNMSIDRKRSDKYYEKGNIQFVCVMANKMKNLYTNKILYDWSKNIVRNLGKNYRN